MKNLNKSVLLLTVLLGVGCSNENLNVQLSDADSEADRHNGTILYSGYSFQLHRVVIDGVSYIANTRGGIVKE